MTASRGLDFKFFNMEVGRQWSLCTPSMSVEVMLRNCLKRAISQKYPVMEVDNFNPLGEVQ
jgi:hypothetical protein